MSNRNRNGSGRPQAPQVPQMQVPIIGQGPKMAVPAADGITDPSQVEPMFDNVLIRQLEFTEMAGDIVVSTSASEHRLIRGIVLAVGDGRWSDVMEWKPPVGLKVGDIVFLHNTQPLPVYCGKEQVYLIRAREVIFRLTDDAAKLVRESMAEPQSSPSKLIT